MRVGGRLSVFCHLLLVVCLVSQGPWWKIIIMALSRTNKKLNGLVMLWI